MSDLQYYNYEGVGKTNQKLLHYSQAVRRNGRIELSGQGGWNPTTGEIVQGMEDQIDQACENVSLALRDAGGTGWDQVYRVRSYHCPLTKESMDAMVRNFKKRMPNHQPIWTCVGVAALGEEGMQVEIEVIAQETPKL